MEVNSISKSQLDWTSHKKVPQVAYQLTLQNNNEKYYEKIVQVIDSTVIISTMEALRLNSPKVIGKMTNYIEKICAGSIQDQKSLNEMLSEIDSIIEKDKERKWRNWIYTSFIHVISPNIYRTMGESIAAYYWFDKVGDWGNLFSRLERMTITYLGSSYMYLLSMNLKRIHGLKEDVRESLYEYCNEWTSSLDFRSQFMGGLTPNLADLTLYGTINTFEGCQAFTDMTCKNPLMKQWYESCKLHVNNSMGNSFLKLSTELTPTQTKQNKSRILFNFIKQNFISPISS